MERTIMNLGDYIEVYGDIENTLKADSTMGAALI
jgi:hypothetical protein